MKLSAASYGVCSEEESPQEGRLSFRGAHAADRSNLRSNYS